jgi:hypothetical protein
VIVVCDAPECVRGLVHRDGGWADPCKFCGGVGHVSFASICRMINEHESTMRKLLKPKKRMRARTAARILDKLIAIYPNHFGLGDAR